MVFEKIFCVAIPYRSLLKAAFYADVSESEFAHAASQLHCDEPNGGAVASSEITPARFGTVPRHYIRILIDFGVQSSSR